ncbi:MAG TPA: GNAT family N-acetyltransferase [Micromonosporaceae bacterium]
MTGADVLLSDGSTVHIRQIQPDDADRMVAMHARLSDRSRYLRYFSPYPRIPPRDLARFVNVDHLDREALVVAIGEDLIAVGRYERLGAHAPDAEVAFEVDDVHQGRGLGSMLLEHLAAAAAEVGITRFVAEVLPQNAAMLRVFADAGYQVSREYADGVVHLTFPIAPTERSMQVQRDREQRTEAASIARLLAPRSVALYGVRRNGSGAGAALLRHVLGSGFSGAVYLIHPTAATVAGQPAYRSATEATGPIDLALIAVPASGVSRAIEDAGRAGAHAAVVVTAGFAETGPVGARREASLVARARAQRLRLVGPNGFGVINTDPAVRLNASLAPHLPGRGRVGVFCQSAAVAIAVLTEASDRGLGISSFVSAGNRADVSGNDVLQFWRVDPHTDVVLLYLETFGNPRKFARIARELGRDKPVVAVAAGAVGRPYDAATAPAAAPAVSVAESAVEPVVGDGADAGMDALFAHSGVIRVDTVAELLDVGQVLAHQPLPAGDRIGVVGNATALSTLAAGSCARAGLTVAAPPRTVATDAAPAALREAVEAALRDDQVDLVFVVVAPPPPVFGGSDRGHGRRRLAAYEAAVAQAVVHHDKPVVTTLVGGRTARAATVPIFGTVEEAARAVAKICRYAGWRRTPLGTTPPPASPVDSDLVDAVVERRGPAGELLAAYGIDVVPAQEAGTEREALRLARRLGYPVAIKANDPNLRHRLDLGAVRLDLADSSALRRAYAEIAARFTPRVLVQPMAPPGVACVLETVDDPSFGPMVGFGLGGIASDLLGDRAWRVAPLSGREAADLVRAPRAAQMLFGYRGSPAVDTGALAGLLLVLGRLAEENPGVKRLLLNPVLVSPAGLAVLHAEVRYGPAGARPDTGPRRLR